MTFRILTLAIVCLGSWVSFAETVTAQGALQCIAKRGCKPDSLIMKENFDVNGTVSTTGSLHIDRKTGTAYRDSVIVTLLDYAAGLCWEDVVKALLSKGANPKLSFTNPHWHPGAGADFTRMTTAVEEARFHLKQTQTNNEKEKSEKCDSTLALLEEAEGKSGVVGTLKAMVLGAVR